MELNKTETQILKQLKQDGNSTPKALSQDLNLTKVYVWRKLQDLLKEDLVEKKVKGLYRLTERGEYQLKY